MRLFGVVVTSWLTGDVPEPNRFDRLRSLDGFMATWVFGLARRLRRSEAAPLMAAPTHAGGWIDPRVLVERFRLRCTSPVADEPADLILALLRLAPDHRAAALADAGDLEGERGAAIRHALGSDGETIGPSAALWAAAARARAPWSDDPAVEVRHPGLGPDAARAAIYRHDRIGAIRRGVNATTLWIEREPAVPRDERCLTDLPTSAYHYSKWVTPEQWPNPASLWPIALESFFAAGAQQLVEASEASTDWQGSRCYLIPQLDPDVPLHPMARLVLAIGLNATLPEIAGLATDALVAAIDDGRIDADKLGESLCMAWRLREDTTVDARITQLVLGTPQFTPYVKPGRWAKTLGDVARRSVARGRGRRGDRSGLGGRVVGKQDDRELASPSRVAEGNIRRVGPSGIRCGSHVLERDLERGQDRSRRQRAHCSLRDPGHARAEESPATGTRG